MPWSWSSRIKTGNGPCIGQPDGTGLCESSFRRVVIWRMGAPSLDCFFKEYEWRKKKERDWYGSSIRRCLCMLIGCWEGIRRERLRLKQEWGQLPNGVKFQTGGDRLFILLNCNSILSVTQAKSLSSMHAVGSFFILRRKPSYFSPSLSENPVCTAFTIDPKSNSLCCCLSRPSYCWPGLCWLFLHQSL